LVVGALVLLAILGAQSVLIPLFVAELPVAALGDYVSKLLPTLPLILVALGLGTVFAVMAFKSTSADAKLLRKPTLIASLFWLCLCLVFMYHVLWVVFMTAMVTIWPFKTFVPNTK
ncbi:MAG TPA: hypothetical protein VMS08_04470, partial [Candidatus Saccharimonadia bacterium]|nr:hypothetical protein [Candidatus Saccharimonadia bacterium]